MSHFSAGDWVDFVHKLLPASRHSQLRSHLDQECPECVKAAIFWNLVDKSLAQEPRYDPPEPLFEAVQRLYSSHKPWQGLNPLARWAKLVFDSFRQPSLAFVRGPRSSDRHLVYEAEPFVIDVTLKADAAQDGLLLLGQVLNSANPEQTPSEVHVVVLSGEELIAKTVASASGEFELRCEAHPDLSLFISISGERAIGLSLRDARDGEDRVV